MLKICILRSLFIRPGPTCAHTILDWSVILVKATTITHVVALEWPPCFLHSTQCFSPCFFGNFQWTNPFWAFLGMWYLLKSIMGFPLVSVGLFGFWDLASRLALFLMFSSTSNKALVLTGVVFLVKMYWVCHLDGHIHSIWVERSASSKSNTYLVA